MERVVALLRGVNVGGRKLSMADVRTALEADGCTDVATYIQSGNVVLTPPKGTKRHGLETWLSERISAVAGYDVAVVLRTASELDATVAANPYPHAGGTALHVVFHAQSLAPGLYDSIDAGEFASEEFTVVGRDVYLHLPNGMGRAVLPVAMEKARRRAKAEQGTARNWNTVLKLQSMAAN